MNLSGELFETAKAVIPGGVNSPVRSFKHVLRPPVYFSRGEGAYLYDVSGKKYVDFCLSFGPHLFGHSPNKVVRAVQRQAERGMSFGACHPGEVEFAKEILRSYAFLDQVRLVNSGTEAVMTAIRLARGKTQRSKIVKFDGCYHGHSDGLLAKAGSGIAQHTESDSRGVSPSIVSETLIARYGDMTQLNELFSRFGQSIAAVILEPIPANYGLWVPPRELLTQIIELARLHGSLVIFDEVISGFRVGATGACGYYDLKPDLVTLGKIIGGGLPLAALVGTRECMENLAPIGEVYQAGTLSGNVLAVTAGLAMLEEIYANPPYRVLEKRTQSFVDELSQVLNQRTPVEIRTVGSMFWMNFDRSQSFPPEISTNAKGLFTQLFNSLLDNGVYLPPSPYEVAFLSTEHTDAVLEDVLEKVKAWPI